MKILGLTALLCGIVGVSIGVAGLALASTDSSSDESEDNNAPGEECIMGPADWKELMEKNPTTQEFKENYENSVRSYEIKQYIDDNKDDLGVPDYFDDDLILCGVADDVAEKERATGTQFMGEELDTNIQLVLMSKMGDAASKLFENPGLYLNP